MLTEAHDGVEHGLDSEWGRHDVLMVGGDTRNRREGGMVRGMGELGGGAVEGREGVGWSVKLKSGNQVEVR